MAKRLTWYILGALLLGLFTGWAINSAVDNGTPEVACSSCDGDDGRHFRWRIGTFEMGM